MGTIGVARENALAVLNKAEADPDVAYTVKKNLKWFGEYYLGDMLFNAAFDTLRPVLGAAKHILFPASQTVKGALKGATETDVTNLLSDLVAARELSPTQLDMLKGSEALRALQAHVKVLQNMGSATPEDLFSTVMSRFGYSVNPVTLGPVAPLSEAARSRFSQEVFGAVPKMSNQQGTWWHQWTTQNDFGALTKLADSLGADSTYQQALQSFLKDLHQGDSVTIYRGGITSSTSNYSYGSFKESMAQGFANSHTGGTVQAYRVPLKDVIAVGSAKEGEVIFRTEGMTLASEVGQYLKVSPVVKEADPKGVIPSLKFKDVQAAQQWFVQEGVTPGRGMTDATGLASQTYKEAKAVDASVTPQAHYDATKTALENGFIVRPEVLADHPDLLPLHLQPVKTLEPAAGAFAANLNETIRARVKNPAATDTLVRLFAPDKQGTFQADKLQAFMRHYGRVVGATAEDVSKLKIIPSSDGTKLTIVTPKETADFPASGANEENVLRAVTQAIDSVLPTELKAGAGLKSAELYLGYGESLMNQKLFTPEWTNQAAAKLGFTNVKNADGSFSLVDKTGVVQVTGTQEDLKLTLVRKSVDENYLKAFLQEQGYTLGKKTEGDYFVLKPGNANAIAKGATIEDLLRGHPELMPKIPSQLGPDVAVVVPGQRVDVLYAKNIAVGNYQDLLKVLDSYASRTKSLTKVSLHVGKSGYIYANKISKQLDIYIPEISYRKTFPLGTKVEEVKAYLETGWKSATELKKIANQKGYMLQPWGGKWILHSDGNSYLAKDIAEVHSILQKAPIPEWAPELTGLTEESLVGLIPPDGAFPQKDWLDPMQTPSGYDLKKQIYQSTSDFLENWTKAGGDPVHLANFRAIEHARGVVSGADHEASVAVHTIFTDKGKLMPLGRRTYIGEYLRAPEAQKAAVAASRGLTDAELRAAGQMRTYWNGLFTKFGVDPKKFIEDYFPHIMDYMQANPLKQFTERDTGKLLKEVFGPTPPKELRAFFKYNRLNDLLQVTMEQDPLVAMLKYTAVGNRQLYLGPAWEQTVKSTMASEDIQGAKRMRKYLGDVMGIPQSSTEEVLRAATLQTFMKYGASKGLGEDLIKNAMSLGYVAALGFNPFKAFRNYLDMFITVAPRLGLDGNKDIIAALNFIRSDTKGEFFDLLKAKGIITAGQPVSGGEALVEKGLMKKILDNGMAMYQNSDHLTRAAAYKAAEIRWSRAQAHYQNFIEGKGPRMTAGEFEEASGLGQMAPDLANQARSLVSAGKWDVAKELYATNFVRETLFPFRSGLSPTVFRGTVGKLFGMMGHYSIYYVENIKRAIKYGSTASKLAFAASFLGNSAILYSALQSAGIDGSTYLPWNPIQFSGGPYYQMLNQGLTAFGRGYQGRQARAELFGVGSKEGKITWDPSKGNLFKWLVPGSFEMMKWQQAVDLYNAGDTWGAGVAIGGATPNSDWLGGPSQ